MTTFDRMPTKMSLELPITLRLARQSDLPKLEWFGQYTHFRNLFRRTYRDQLQGKRLMLIADCNDFPIGHIFVQLNAEEYPQARRRAYLYSLRVMEMFRGHGLGTRLIQEAEIWARDYRCMWTTIAVAKDNLGARRLYERMGYRVVSEDSGEWSYLDHLGELQTVSEPCWVLEKKMDIR